MLFRSLSPNGTSITVEKDDNSAYVLDRVLYDKYLFNRAVDAGATAFYGERVLDVDMDNTRITTTNGKYSSNIIAVACGPNSATSKKMNPNFKEESYTGIQYTLKTEPSDTEYVDVRVNTSILPGFIWKIPVSPT